MTTQRIRVLVSLAATVAATLSVGACVRAPVRTAPAESEPMQARPLSIRFDNGGREYVHVYLVGLKREWLLGRVEPGAVTTLRLPQGSVTEETGFVRLAVVAGGATTLAAVRDVRARVTMAQPATVLAAQRWRFAEGQLTGLAGRR
jgi:glucose/arabinose dehydrogenase